MVGQVPGLFVHQEVPLGDQEESLGAGGGRGKGGMYHFQSCSKRFLFQDGQNSGGGNFSSRTLTSTSSFSPESICNLRIKIKTQQKEKQ